MPTPLGDTSAECWRQIPTDGDLLKVADAMLQRVLPLGMGIDFDVYCRFSLKPINQSGEMVLFVLYLCFIEFCTFDAPLRLLKEAAEAQLWQMSGGACGRYVS